MKNAIDKIITDLQKLDPLSEAEKITGNEYKKDDATVMFGMHIQMKKSEDLKKLFTFTGDVHFSMKYKDYLKTLTGAGFEIVYEEKFINFRDKSDEFYYVLFNYHYGVLIAFDTYNENVNGGNMYYNWMPNSTSSRFDCTSSGGFYSSNSSKTDHLSLFNPSTLEEHIIENFPALPKWEEGQTYEEFKEIMNPIADERDRMFTEAEKKGFRAIWIGDHDCREGVLLNIKRFCEQGGLLIKWIKQPFMYLVHWGHKIPEGRGELGRDYKEITAEVISKLPARVQEAIGKYEQ